MNCRHCGASLQLVLADLGEMPLSNAMLERPDQPEPMYPLRVLVCESCWLVQTEDFAHANEIFDNAYTYFSSYSESWLDHARRYVDMIAERLSLSSRSQVIEIASNDGYLLQYFREKRIPALGIEPTANTAEVAAQKGIETIVDFFGADLAARLAAQGRQADLIIGNNVLAHVPDINDFVAGLARLLKPDGVITMEFPHLLQLVDQCQFDTIYHEHFSYLSLTAVNAIFSRHGLTIFHVEELPTHGGSLRIYARRHRVAANQSEMLRKAIRDWLPAWKARLPARQGGETGAVDMLLDTERQSGITTRACYTAFQERVNAIRDNFLEFLDSAHRDRKTIAAYGAAAKGNTLLNYCGVTAEQIAFVADASPHKQGKFLPGSHLPVVSPEEIRTQQPNFVVILPWNLREEIMNQLSYIREWGGQFVVAVPELAVSRKL